MISYIDQIKEFREYHHKCELRMIRVIGDEYLFTCNSENSCLNLSKDGHVIQKIAVVMPFGCRYPSLDCAISGYCKRDIACNH